MTTLFDETAYHFLSEALSSDFGIKVRVIIPGHSMVTPSIRARQIFYRIRAEYPDFKPIQIRISPDDPDNQIWLLKGRAGEKQLPPDRDETDYLPDGSLDIDL